MCTRAFVSHVLCCCSRLSSPRPLCSWRCSNASRMANENTHSVPLTPPPAPTPPRGRAPHSPSTEHDPDGRYAGSVKRDPQRSLKNICARFQLRVHARSSEGEEEDVRLCSGCEFRAEARRRWHGGGGAAAADAPRRRYSDACTIRGTPSTTCVVLYYCALIICTCTCFRG